MVNFNVGSTWNSSPAGSMRFLNRKETGIGTNMTYKYVVLVDNPRGPRKQPNESWKEAANTMTVGRLFGAKGL
jgi:hypothetical protein